MDKRVLAIFVALTTFVIWIHFFVYNTNLEKMAINKDNPYYESTKESRERGIAMLPKLQVMTVVIGLIHSLLWFGAIYPRKNDKTNN